MNEYVLSFLYGLLTAVILAFIQDIIVRIYIYIHNLNKYSINGFWISNYKSVFDLELRANDIVWIRLTKNKLLITYQQYTNKSNSCKKFSGEGLIYNGRIAISYYYSHDKIYQNGVMLLTHIDLKATKKGYSGAFYEFDSRNLKGKGKKIFGSELKIYTEDYILIPIKLTIFQKIKFIFNKPIFKPSSQISEEFDNLYNDIL